MAENTSETNGARSETIQPSEPAQAKAPVASMTDALPDDQLDVTGGGAYPMVITTYVNTGIAG
ncbi:hypothetical protein NLM33_18120 [Bradyrhizobium sp. CCGUVB1N3]|uniref:hypothetical protein n=1 Tax=Bradyrhizobium sp. CCGUVB1N3 TaxID=2949629 RepID=UPI0020B22CDF|nr:hypothetical protein [Bradyrhizobium sp. CCGUVB1N3]MCP3472234.1 hypothetical protein [Bradyrhizobium sp. CCGUVB1N3]